MVWNRPGVLLLLLLILAAAWWQWRPAPGELRRTRFLMGTTVEIVAAGPNPSRLDRAVDAALVEMTRLERLLGSGYADSDPARLNRSDQALKVASETVEVLQLGQDVAQRSGGAFDLGLGRLKALWGLEGATPQVPTAAQIATALEGTGPHSLEITDQTARRRTDVAIDLGGIAKGYIVDAGLRVLREHGVTQAAINAGGDMALLGRPADRPWRVGIQHPRRPTEVLATLLLDDCAVVTSGDYERFFESGGQRYHHLFDPATGYPAQTSQSVTVVAASAALADALATALFVLGAQEGLELLHQFPGTAALLVDARGVLHTSPSMDALISP